MPSRRGSSAPATLVRPPSPRQDRRPGPNLPLPPPTDRADPHCRDRLARNFEPSGPPPSLPCRPNVDPPVHQPRLCARPAPDAGPAGTDAPDGHPPPTAPTPTAETGWLVISSRAPPYGRGRGLPLCHRRPSHACAQDESWRQVSHCDHKPNRTGLRQPPRWAGL